MLLSANQLQLHGILKAKAMRDDGGWRERCRRPKFSDVFLFELGFSVKVYLSVSLLKAWGRTINEIEEPVKTWVSTEIAIVQLEGIILPFANLADEQSIDIHPIQLRIRILLELKRLEGLLCSWEGWELYQTVWEIIFCSEFFETKIFVDLHI